MLDWLLKVIREFGGVPAELSDRTGELIALQGRASVQAAGAVAELILPQMRRPLRRTVDKLEGDLDRLDAHLGRA